MDTSISPTNSDANFASEPIFIPINRKTKYLLVIVALLAVGVVSMMLSSFVLQTQKPLSSNTRASLDQFDTELNNLEKQNSQTLDSLQSGEGNFTLSDEKNFFQIGTGTINRTDEFWLNMEINKPKISRPLGSCPAKGEGGGELTIDGKNTLCNISCGGVALTTKRINSGFEPGMCQDLANSICGCSEPKENSCQGNILKCEENTRYSDTGELQVASSNAIFTCPNDNHEYESTVISCKEKEGIGRQDLEVDKPPVEQVQAKINDICCKYDENLANKWISEANKLCIVHNTKKDSPDEFQSKIASFNQYLLKNNKERICSEISSGGELIVVCCVK